MDDELLLTTDMAAVLELVGGNLAIDPLVSMLWFVATSGAGVTSVSADWYGTIRSKCPSVADFEQATSGRMLPTG